jgi:hypothetical protein
MNTEPPSPGPSGSDISGDAFNSHWWSREHLVCDWCGLTLHDFFAGNCQQICTGPPGSPRPARGEKESS